MSDNKNNHEYQYIPAMSRRDSLKWLSVLAASAAMPALVACTAEVKTPVAKVNAGHWPELDLAPVTELGYGKDPNLVMIAESPWARTLSSGQLTLVALLSDILIPRDGDYPSATEMKVPDVVDEWVSAPYESQQRDRITILSALAWMDDEANLRFSKVFSALGKSEQMAIIDDIAYDSEATPDEFKRIAAAFSRFRALVLAAYFCSPQGTKEIGYQGNVAIAGDYPGPTDEAMGHLNKVLDELGLSEFAYK